MSESADIISDLRERVLRLEGLYSIIDLLGLPGLLSGGAAKIFDTVQTAATLGDQTPGFYPRETTSGGLPLRWTRYPEPAELAVPVLEGYPFRLELSTLAMPHIQAAEDIELSLSEVGPIVFAGPKSAASGVFVFVGDFVAPKSGLLTASLTSRTHLGGAGSEQRRLGAPFVSLRSFPVLPHGLGEAP